MQTDNYVYCNNLDIYNNASTRHDIKIKCHITVHCHLERSSKGTKWLSQCNLNATKRHHPKCPTTPNAPPPQMPQLLCSSYSTNKSAASTSNGSCSQRNAHNRNLRKDTLE